MTEGKLGQRMGDLVLEQRALHGNLFQDLPNVAMDWLRPFAGVPTPNPEVMEVYMPISLAKRVHDEQGGSTDLAKGEISYMPHFNKGNMWFMSSPFETDNSSHYARILPRLNGKKILYARNIADMRGCELGIYEIVHYDDGTFIKSRTIRHLDGSWTTQSQYMCIEDGNPCEYFLTRQTKFKCKFCIYIGEECTCPAHFKVRSCSGGVSPINNNSVRHLLWTDFRDFLSDVFNTNEGIATMHVYKMVEPRSRLRQVVNVSRNVKYRVFDRNSKPLLDVKDRFILEHLLRLGPPRPASSSDSDKELLGAMATCASMSAMEASAESVDPQKPSNVLWDTVRIEGPMGAASGPGSHIWPWGGSRVHDMDLKWDPAGAQTASLTDAASSGRCKPTSVTTPSTASASIDLPPNRGLEPASAEQGGSPLPDAKRFSCEQCGKSFKRRFDMNRHVSTVHEKVRKFECKRCKLRFLQVSHLSEHIASVHDNKRPVFCEKCNLTFTSPTRLRRHDRSVHQRLRPHECTTCGQAFFQKTDLNKHLRLKHSVSGPDGS